MSRTETEQGCSTEKRGSESLVSASFGSLPDTLAAIACGLDLAELDSPNSQVAAIAPSPLASAEAQADEVASNVVAPKDATAPVVANAGSKEPLVAVTSAAAKPSTSNSTRSGQTKRSSRSSSSPKVVAPPRKPVQPQSGKIWETLRSRRVRVVMTFVGVLMLAGLIGINMRSSSTTADLEVDELEMSEFGQNPNEQMVSGDGSMQEPAAFSSGFENQQMVTTNTEEWETSAPRLPPLGLPVMNDSNVIPASGINRPQTSGQRGAWLTGQIEIEPNGVVPVSGFRTSFGVQR